MVQTSKWWFRVFSGMALLAGSAQAADPVVLPEVTVYGESIHRFPGPVAGTAIYDGKKAEIISLENRPPIVNNNYRQALDQTPGLLLSEESTPLLSLGYRGLPPHRAQYSQLLKDGIPIHADMFGYPEAYYTPPLEMISQIDFIRGGASLMYGPQPGGALNYVTRNPRTDVPVAFETRQTFGSDNFYSTFNAVEGTSGQLGYLGFLHYRESDGFREANSDFDLINGGLTLTLDASESTRWTATVDLYEEEHGEPGGLTLATGGNAVNYRENRKATSRFYDRFELERYAGTLGLEHDLSDDTLVQVNVWGGYYSRYSQRQRGGGFGTLPAGPDADSNIIELQEFNTAALEARMRHAWRAWDEEHTLVAGTMYYHVDSPRTDKRGASARATDGRVINDSDRTVEYVPVFVENRFVFGDFSLTPGLRLENIWQDVEEKANAAKTAADVPLGSKRDRDTVPLFGLGAAWKAAPGVEWYANASQSYRPKTFTETVPTGGTTLVPDDLDASDITQYDIGVRGQAAGVLTWDASLFLMNVDDQIGTLALPGGRSTLVNVGKSRHRGIEAALEFDLSGAIDALASTSLKDDVGSFILFGNAMLLDAEFTEGPLDGKTPQYAPDYLIRTGIRYALSDRLQLSLGGTVVDDHYADDTNTAERFIPAYVVWDLTAEVRVYKDFVSLFGGINNLFDEDYYARIRNDGIDPAAERNYFAGIKIALF